MERRRLIIEELRKCDSGFSRFRTEAMLMMFVY